MELFIELFKSDEEKLIEAIKYKNIEKIKSILKNSTKNKKILNLNERNIFEKHPVDLALYQYFVLFLIIFYFYYSLFVIFML